MSSAPIDTEEAFHEALRELIEEAHDFGIVIEGGWAVQNGEKAPDFDVEIVELAKPTEPTSAVDE